MQQIEHFFAHYKDLEPNKWVKIMRWGDAEEARKLVVEGMERAKGSGQELSAPLKRARRRNGRRVKRSFIDARIEAMLALCERYGVACPPFALWGERTTDRHRDAARLIAERGLGWNIVEFQPGAFASDGLTCSRCAWATGAISKRARPALCGKGDDEPRTASARRITITSSRPRTSSTAAARGSWSSSSRSTRRRADEGSASAALKDVSTLDLGPGERVRLEPGESLTLEPFVAHAFWAEGGRRWRARCRSPTTTSATIISSPRLRRLRRSKRTRRRGM